MSDFIHDKREGMDLVAKAISSAAENESDLAALKEFALEILLHVENNYIGDGDASTKKQITLDVYRLVETHLQEQKKLTLGL